MLNSVTRVMVTLAFVPSLLALSSGSAAAQEAVPVSTSQVLVVRADPPPPAAPALTTDLEDPPSYGLSIGLHVSAIICSILGTVGSIGGFIGALAQAFGGSGDGGLAAGIGIAGAVLLTGGIALGISASAVHANTSARRSALAALPFMWADATGGGGGLVLRY